MVPSVRMDHGLDGADVADAPNDKSLIVCTVDGSDITIDLEQMTTKDLALISANVAAVLATRRRLPPNERELDKPASLLTLPRELRAMIYDYCGYSTYLQGNVEDETEIVLQGYADGESHVATSKHKIAPDRKPRSRKRRRLSRYRYEDGSDLAPPSSSCSSVCCTCKNPLIQTVEHKEPPNNSSPSESEYGSPSEYADYISPDSPVYPSPEHYMSLRYRAPQEFPDLRLVCRQLHHELVGELFAQYPVHMRVSVARVPKEHALPDIFTDLIPIWLNPLICHIKLEIRCSMDQWKAMRTVLCRHLHGGGPDAMVELRIILSPPWAQMAEFCSTLPPFCQSEDLIRDFESRSYKGWIQAQAQEFEMLTAVRNLVMIQVMHYAVGLSRESLPDKAKLELYSVEHAMLSRRGDEIWWHSSHGFRHNDPLLKYFSNDGEYIKDL